MAPNRTHPAGLRGWTDIGSDVSWEDYGGKWARRAKDGSWYVLDFTNMYDACGEDECKRDGQAQYVCEVKRVDLADLHEDTIKSALDCVGLQRFKLEIWDTQGNRIANREEDVRRYELVLVEACVAYGAAQPLESFSGDSRPANVRANARRAAEGLMRDADKLEERLERPVNKIGSTAREYGRGDVTSAMLRGPCDTAKGIMLKMHGATDDEIAAHRAIVGGSDDVKGESQ